MGIIFSSFNGLEAYPKLRFLEFKNAYKKIKLNEAVERIQRKDPTSEAPIMMLSAASGFIMQSEKYSRENAGQSLKKYILLRKGELAYNHGASKYKPFGCCFELKEDEARIPYVYHCFAVKENNDKSYIARLLNNQKIDQQLKRLISSSVRMDGLLNISYEEYTGIDLYLPSLLEQQKIADFLFLVDRRIEKQRQLVESLKKYKRGLFSYYFQKNKSYKIARLGDFAKIYQPSTISQSQFNDGKYKVFGANGYIGNYDKYNHAVPQVTISCRGEKCGTVNFVDAYTWITGNSMVVNIDDQNEINKRYLYHCLSNQNLKYLVSGSAQPQIIRTDVARHSIPVPSIEFQEKLSFFLDSIEEKIKNEQNMEECLLDMKNALLQQMFI